MGIYEPLFGDLNQKMLGDVVAPYCLKLSRGNVTREGDVTQETSTQKTSRPVMSRIPLEPLVMLGRERQVKKSMRENVEISPHYVRYRQSERPLKRGFRKYIKHNTGLSQYCSFSSFLRHLPCFPAKHLDRNLLRRLE